MVILKQTCLSLLLGQFVSQTDSLSHGVLESQDHTTQESIMDDSGFLPSTPPPTKKVNYSFTSCYYNYY